MVDTADPGEITRLLCDWAAERAQPAPELWSLVYGELRRIAEAYMRKERADHTLQRTALVNEAYLRVFRGGGPFRWENRKHFFCAMAQAMRRILVDHARERDAEKRNGAHKRLSLDAALRPAPRETSSDLMALDEALQRLAKRHPRQAQVVELRFFVGLTADQTAAILNISAETVKLDWRFAKAWLRRQIRAAHQ